MKKSTKKQDREKYIGFGVLAVIGVIMLFVAPGWLLFAALALVYFIPSVLALLKKKKNAAGIIAINVFLGWSILGWIIALVWALCED